MAYVYDNKTYRNLQQQVKENMEDIAKLQDLKLVGLDVKDIVPYYSSLPASADQGQVYAVGTKAPFELYVYNDSSWVDFGEFPKAGPKGDQGPQGQIGNPGPIGLTGKQGPRGYTGAPGAPGQAGPQGERGPKGDPGPQGPAGQDGTVSFDELTPEQLDMLKGPKGDTGPQGPQGPQGLQGPEGPEGPMGPKGETGATGPKGDTGERGPQGIQGPKGDKGETGDAGPAGERGPIGPEGPEGPQGPIGPEGPKGDKGDTGEQGPQGPVGPQGPKGDPGEVPPDVATETYVNATVGNAKTSVEKTVLNWLDNYATKSDVNDNIQNTKDYADEQIANASIAIISKIPTKTSQLTNDSNFVTSTELSTVATSGSYADLTNKPTIPTTTSQLDNDSGFITSEALTGYATEAWVWEQGYQTSSEVSTAVSTAISSQNKETWTFTLSDGSTVTKSVVLGE